jgi:hypothetical protein
MKFRIVYTIFSISFLALLFMSNSNGRADSQNWGNTGAPGDEMIGTISRTCMSCHSSNASVEMIQEIEVFDDMNEAVASYTPGQTYRVRVTNTVVSGSGVQGYGFQIVNLKAAEGEDGDDSASFSNPADNVKIAVASNTNRQYAEHNGVEDNNVFEVDWTAPEQGTGAVTFYACGNAVNGNGMNSGDAAACSVLELSEADPSSVSNPNGGINIYLFPNPVREEMKVTLISDASAEFNIEVYDMQGRLMVKDKVTFGTGESNYFVNVSDLSKGTYLVKFYNEEKVATAKMLKI